MRKTWGFHKESDMISYSQIKVGTGIKSDATISQCLQKLLSNGLIICTHEDAWMASTIGIDREYELDIPSTSKIEVPTSKIEDTKDVTVKTVKTVEKKIVKRNKIEWDNNFTYLMPGHLLESQQFLNIWNDWINYRAEKKKPITDTTAKRQIALLSKYNAAVAVAMIDQTIINGWQGIFQLNDRHPLMRSSSGPLSDAGATEMESLKSA